MDRGRRAAELGLDGVDVQPDQLDDARLIEGRGERLAGLRVNGLATDGRPAERGAILLGDAIQGVDLELEMADELVVIEADEAALEPRLDLRRRSGVGEPIEPLSNGRLESLLIARPDVRRELVPWTAEERGQRAADDAHGDRPDEDLPADRPDDAGEDREAGDDRRSACSPRRWRGRHPGRPDGLPGRVDRRCRMPGT